MLIWSARIQFVHALYDTRFTTSMNQKKNDDSHSDKKAFYATTECEYSFGCLTSGKLKLCEIERVISGVVHFTKCLDESDCVYKKGFGTRLIMKNVFTLSYFI
jgi:hypothetical protein